MNFYMFLYQIWKKESFSEKYIQETQRGNIILRNIIPQSLIGPDCESRCLSRFIKTLFQL